MHFATELEFYFIKKEKIENQKKMKGEEKKEVDGTHSVACSLL